jgi:hypothetical protein
LEFGFGGVTNPASEENSEGILGRGLDRFE